MKLALTYDDVALVPRYNNVDSRAEPSMETWLTRGLQMGIPIVPSNMDTVISPKLACVMDDHDGVVIVDRMHSTLEELKKYPVATPLFASIGLRGCGKVELESLTDVITGICVDVAHGHSKMMLDTITSVKNKWPALQVIAGNVCTPEGYRDLANAGADAIRVGIGPGSICTTRLVTGFGVPQFTAVQECGKVAKEMHVPMIADGGIRNSRDILLALAAGASSVMVGGLFAATEESAAQKETRYEATAMHGEYIFHESPPESGGGTAVEINGEVNKVYRVAVYRGQASHAFQEAYYGGLKEGTVPEGETVYRRVTGPARALLGVLLGGLRSGLTYCGSRDIKELHRKAEFVRVTPAYTRESNTRS